MTVDRPLSEEDVALVFRRAAELDVHPGSEHQSFDVATLERIGAEAGLSPAAVRQAVAELRAGRLRAAAPARRLSVGPSEIVVERRVPVGTGPVAERLESYLRRQQFRVCRRLGTLSVWEPNNGLVANLTRGIDLTDRIRLAPVQSVELLVEGDRSASSVRIVLGVGKLRRNALAGVTAGGALGGAGVVTGIVAVVAGIPELLMTVPAAAAGAAGAVVGSRSSFDKKVKRAVDAVELVRDELELR